MAHDDLPETLSEAVASGDRLRVLRAARAFAVAKLEAGAPDYVVSQLLGKVADLTAQIESIEQQRTLEAEEQAGSPSAIPDELWNPDEL